MQYKVLRNWSDGVAGIIGPDVGSIIGDITDAKERLARGDIEVYENKRVNADNTPKGAGSGAGESVEAVVSGLRVARRGRSAK